ncbi:MAG: cyclic nucleotide-binding domain-containing protein [Myxococcota bacterium]
MSSTQLSATDIHRLASCAQHRIYSAGEYLLHHSEVTNSLFYIQRGTAAVLQKNKDPLASDIIISSGEFLGEISFLLDKPRTATVVAREETECLVFEPSVLRSYLLKPENDGLGRSFYQTLSLIAANRLVSSNRPTKVNLQDHHDPLRQHIERRIYARLVGLIEAAEQARKSLNGLMRRAYQLQYDDSVQAELDFASLSETDLAQRLSECHDLLSAQFHLSIDAVNQVLEETHSSFRRAICGRYAQQVCMPILQDTLFFSALQDGGYSETLAVMSQVYQGHMAPKLDPILGDSNINLMMNHWLLSLPTFAAMRSAFEILRERVSAHLNNLPDSDESLQVTIINDVTGGVLAGIFVPLAKRKSEVQVIVDSRDGIDSILPWNGYSQSVHLKQRKQDFSQPNLLFSNSQELIVIPNLLDYMPDMIALTFLSQVKDALQPGACVFLSCMGPTHDQPFVTSALGWNTIRRSKAQVQHLLMASGLDDNIIWDEDNHSMVICGRRQN